MTVYYGKLADGSFGFMDTVDFGEPTIMVPDPQWQRPTMLVPDPAWQASEQPAGSPAPLIEVPDLSAQPSIVEVDNPACRIPPNACPVSAEQYSAMMAAQEGGKVISRDADGRPMLIDPPVPTVEQIIASHTAQRTELLSRAAAHIAPLQDAVDLGIATDDEIARLAAWKRYRVQLNRIDVVEPAWPTLPHD